MLSNPRPISRTKRMSIYLVATLSLLLSAARGVAQGTGYWRTSRAQILDANGTRVRIAGINWYGLETTDMAPHGLNVQDYKTILQTIKSNGYNTVRIPYSNQMVESPIVPTSIAYTNASGPINTDLQGLNSLQVLDAVINQAGNVGLRVILDNHRSEAGNGAESNGLWYTSAYPESAWIDDWITLTKRYQNNPTVIGMDLRDEPHNANSGGACWSCGTSTQDWHLAAERAGNAILAVNPQLLIFVEGTDAIGADTYFWGGQLAGVASNPVVLNVQNQLVYSAHDYGPVESSQSWFNSGTTPASLTSVWDTHWGYISAQGIAPIWVGEFGTPNSDSDARDTTAGSEGQWFSSLITYLTNNSDLSWTYWSLNGEDRYGLLDNNYDSTPVNAIKQQELASIEFPLVVGNSVSFPKIAAQTYGAAPLVLSAAASSGLPITYAIVSGPATINGNTLMVTGVGTVTITAQQAASNGYSAASATESFAVNPAPLTVTVQNVSRYANSANPTFTSTITGLVNGDPSSIVSITYNTAATLGSDPGNYPINAKVASIPNYSITVVPGTLTVTPAPATITWANPAAIVYGTPLGATQLNATSTPSLTLTYSPPPGSILNAGTQTLTVGGVNSTITTPVSASVSILVQQASTTTIVSAPSTVTAPYTVTATVSSSNGGAVTGVVNFFDAGVLIGSGKLDSKGTATFVIASLASGPHSFTATYPGDPNNTQSTSQALYIGPSSGDFSISATPATLTLSSGQSGTVALGITPTGGVQGTITLSCAGLPNGSSCTFSPATLNLNGSATIQSSTVTMLIPAAKASLSGVRNGRSVLFAGVLMSFLGLRRRKITVRLLSVLGAAALCCSVGSGCSLSQSAGTTGPTVQGSYNVVLTASAGMIVHTTSVQVNFVQ